MKSIFEKYGISRQEVLEWGMKHYPQFTNENILAQLYLRHVKKVNLDPNDVALMTGKEVDVEDLQPGEWCIIQVVVGAKVRSNSYRGCPECYKRVDDNNMCPKCGLVTPVDLFWDTYVAGDNTGDVMVSFPPRIANEYRNLEGTILKIRGFLNDQGEFIAQNIEVVKEPPKSLEEKKEQTVVEKEVEALRNVLLNFPEVSYEDLKTWHRQRGFTTDLDLLIMKVGAVKDENGKVRLT